MILHDVIANKRLATNLGCWLDRSATKRMNEFRLQWKKFNLGIIHSARRGSHLCPAEKIYRGVETGDLKLEEVSMPLLSFQFLDCKPALINTQFLHTLDEILFANVDVSSAVLNTLFEHLASNTTFQQRLCEEITAQTQTHTQTPSPTSIDTDTTTHTGKYLSKQDTLLHYAVMEAMRFSPAFGQSTSPYSTSLAL